MFTGPFVTHTFFRSVPDIASYPPLLGTKTAQIIGRLHTIFGSRFKIFRNCFIYLAICFCCFSAGSRKHSRTLRSLTCIKLRLHFEMYRFVANFVEYSYCPPTKSLGYWSVLCTGRSCHNSGKLYYGESKFRLYLRTKLLLPEKRPPPLPRPTPNPSPMLTDYSTRKPTSTYDMFSIKRDYKP